MLAGLIILQSPVSAAVSLFRNTPGRQEHHTGRRSGQQAKARVAPNQNSRERQSAERHSQPLVRNRQTDGPEAPPGCQRSQNGTEDNLADRSVEDRPNPS